MKKSRLLATLAATVLLTALVGLYATAQNPTQPIAPVARPAEGQPVAVIDISRVLKNYGRFKAWEEQLRHDMTQAENWVKGERDALKKNLDTLETLKPGHPDYKRLEAEITNDEASLTARIRLQQKKFQEDQAKIYYTAYQEVWQEVDYYARTAGIAMVLRFSTDAADPNRPETVARGVYKQVVWHNQQIDITDVVIRRLADRNARREVRSTPPGPAPVPFGRQP